MNGHDDENTPVALIRGDGIGPEICDATMAAVAAAGGRIAWIECLMGQQALAQAGSELPLDSLDLVKRLGVALKAPLMAAKGSGGVVVREGDEVRLHPSANSGLRRELGLYANIRPVRGYAPISGRHADMDLVIFREITEDSYAGIETRIDDGRAHATKLITRAATQRITRDACTYARQHGRKTISAIHKANVLHETDGLFLRAAREEVLAHPDLVFDDRMIDAACYMLIKHPQAFDVMVLPNQYGDIFSDVAAGLAGSLGLAPGANLGERTAVFEAAHGAAPDIAGQDIVNPLALVLSAAMLLDHLGQATAGQRIRDGVAALLEDAGVLTPDLGGRAGTTQLTRALCQHILDAAPMRKEAVA